MEFTVCDIVHVNREKHQWQNNWLTVGTVNSAFCYYWIRNGWYFTVCDIPSKNFPTVRICHLAVITTNSGFFNFIVFRFTIGWWRCMRPRTRSPTHVTGTCHLPGDLISWLTWRKITNMAEGGAESKELVAKRGSSSIIWNWFGYDKSDMEQNSVICKVCKKTVIAKVGNTINLFHHLKHQHKPEYDESQKMPTDAAKATASSSAKAPVRKLLARRKLATHLLIPYHMISKANDGKN